jgi:ribosomal protein S17
MPLTNMLHPITPLTGRLQELSEGLQRARALTEDSRKYNRERLARKANTGELHVGDTVVIKAHEPLTATSRWDPQWVVTQVRGKVIFIQHQQSANTKVLNQNKVCLVDPNISWDEINPRPVRQSHISTKLTGVRAQPANSTATRIAKEPQLIQQGYIPPPPPPSVAKKRKAQDLPPQHTETPPREREYLHRSAKLPTLTPPTHSEQKRARLELIECVSIFLGH